MSDTSVKSQVPGVLRRLPDSCTLEDVQYELDVLEKIQRGIDQLERGETYTQEEVERHFAKWLSPSSGPRKRAATSPKSSNTSPKTRARTRQAS